MADSMEKLLVGDVLAAQSKQQLIAWMRQASTGPNRLRSAMPADWNAGDKTSNGRNGAANDLLIALPPTAQPSSARFIVSASREPVGVLDRAHAEIGGLFAAAAARR